MGSEGTELLQGKMGSGMGSGMESEGAGLLQSTEFPAGTGSEGSVQGKWDWNRIGMGLEWDRNGIGNGIRGGGAAPEQGIPSWNRPSHGNEPGSTSPSPGGMRFPLGTVHPGSLPCLDGIIGARESFRSEKIPWDGIRAFPAVPQCHIQREIPPGTAAPPCPGHFQGLTAFSMEKSSQKSNSWPSARPFPLPLSHFPGITSQIPPAASSSQGILRIQKFPLIPLFSIPGPFPAPSAAPFPKIQQQPRIARSDPPGLSQTSQFWLD